MMFATNGNGEISEYDCSFAGRFLTSFEMTAAFIFSGSETGSFAARFTSTVFLK